MDDIDTFVSAVDRTVDRSFNSNVTFVDNVAGSNHTLAIAAPVETLVAVVATIEAVVIVVTGLLLLVFSALERTLGTVLMQLITIDTDNRRTLDTLTTTTIK